MKRGVAAVLITVIVLGLVVWLLFAISQTDRHDYNLQEKAHILEQAHRDDYYFSVIWSSGGYNANTGLYEYEFLCETRGGRWRVQYRSDVDMTVDTLDRLVAQREP